LEEPIDQDIDEGPYLKTGSSLIDEVKKSMIRHTYQPLGEKKMKRQKLALEKEQII